MPEELVPKVGMFFDSEEEAYELFRKYAEKAGFPIKWDRAKGTVRDISCSMSGHWPYFKPGQQRVRNKFSKKTGCKVHMKLKDVETDGEEYSGKVMIEQGCTEHNHPLAKTPRVVTGKADALPQKQR